LVSPSFSPSLFHSSYLNTGGMVHRYDIVVYGATGFTGAYILKTLATVKLFEGKSIAVAGRNEKKLRATLDEVASETGVAKVRLYPVIIADSTDEKSIAAMAKQAKVIVNAVGPYVLYGEAIVKAAIENGASHVDISGEPTFLEGMQEKYGEAAKEKGVYIIGACGWDSIPCDLGTDFLKRNFEGTLAYVDTVVKTNPGKAGYCLNTGTYESFLLAIKSHVDGSEAKLHKSIMPKALPKLNNDPNFRPPLAKFQEPGLNAWTMPFMGADKNIVERSQYFDYHENGQSPVKIRTYFTLGSFFTMIKLAMWGAIIGFFALFGPIRRFLINHPEGCSFGMFKKSGPTKEQVKGTSFDYFFFGTGWEHGESPDKDLPIKKASAVCHGPDPAYVATSACICSTALALLDDKENLPKGGGVMTTASAFRDTRIYEYLDTMGVTFDMIEKSK
ncbi:hypothetical protein PMAYCL1PPCAC_19666, partial [Pristionchus mayeri]